MSFKDNKAEEFNEEEIIKDWDDLDISQDLLRGIYAYGFEKPSPIQQKGILPILNNKDLFAQAQSGTGKTGCFVVATLEKINYDVNNVQAIILAPTRELSSQIKNVVDKIGTNIKNLKSKLLVGGSLIDNDINELTNDNYQLLIGCPGRIYDILKRKIININKINLVILDEADEMLSTEFKEQIYNIFNLLNENIQIGLFSATMPYYLQNLIEKIMNDPVKIIVKSDMLTLEGIKQYYINLNDDNSKLDTIKDLFKSISFSQTIIYCNSIKRVQNLYNMLINANYPVIQIHSGLDKNEREKNYTSFRNGVQRILISSNVTARGIDIQQVSTVINYDIPKSTETYLHRIGRSGRWGRKGVAINLITQRDINTLKDIERFYSTQISELPSNFENLIN